MKAQRDHRTIRIFEPEPLGDVTLTPSIATGVSEGQLARAMVEALYQAPPQTGAEALKVLRALFPASPLTVRVAALTASMRR